MFTSEKSRAMWLELNRLGPKDFIERFPEEMLALHRLSLILAYENTLSSPSAIEICYIVGETADQQPLQATKAKKLLKKGIVNRIVIPDFLSKVYDYGYPGPERTLSLLNSYGIPNRKIEIMKPESPVDKVQTTMEMHMLYAWLKQKEVRSSAFLSAPFHEVRTFIAFATAVKKGELLDVGRNYRSFASRPQHWFRVITHNQGIEENCPSELIDEEAKRCLMYWQMGDLIAPSSAFAFFRYHYRS